MGGVESMFSNFKRFRFRSQTCTEPKKENIWILNYILTNNAAPTRMRDFERTPNSFFDDTATARHMIKDAVEIVGSNCKDD